MPRTKQLRAQVTVEQARRAARAAYQRHRLLRELIDAMELRWGKSAGDDYELVPTPHGYEVPLKHVVKQLLVELEGAAARAYDRYKRLSSAGVADVDEELPEQDEVFSPSPGCPR